MSLTSVPLHSKKASSSTESDNSIIVEKLRVSEAKANQALADLEEQKSKTKDWIAEYEKLKIKVAELKKENKALKKEAKSSLAAPAASSELPQVVCTRIISNDIERTFNSLGKSVFEGRWQGQQVAIKQIKAKTKKSREKVHAVANDWYRWRHPGLVSLFGLVEWSEFNQFGFVMEMGKQSLAERIDASHKGNDDDDDDDVDDKEPLSAREALQIGHDVASGLRYLHSLKPIVAHRDVKSSNVLLMRDGRAKLCDFDSATEIEKAYEQTGKAVTISWSAPGIPSFYLCVYLIILLFLILDFAK